MQCFFCQRNIKDVDFKQTDLLRSFISGLGKIRPRKKSGLCASHQRKIARAVKRARYMGLLSYMSKY